MKEKYYTPEIEDFNPGFEFELLEFDNQGSHWNAAIHYGIACKKSSGEYPADPYRILRWIEDKGVRVKCLDRKDIESQAYAHQFNSTFFRKRTSITSQVTINLSNEGLMTICNEEATDDEPVSVLFKGTIKNKSEFKKLLKQLGI